MQEKKLSEKQNKVLGMITWVDSMPRPITVVNGGMEG